MQLQTTLRGVPVAATVAGKTTSLAAAPAVDLRASLRVLQAWPLDSLQLQTQDLNLQALQAGAPRTALAGTVDITTRAQDAPIQARVELRNALPGPWSSQLLPLRQVRGQVVGSLAQRQRLDFNQLELLFGDAAGASGLWTGNAVWQHHELKLQTVLKDLWPQRLDSRAAGMRLSGPLNATLTGLPSPDPGRHQHTTHAPGELGLRPGRPAGQGAAAGATGGGRPGA